MITNQIFDDSLFDEINLSRIIEVKYTEECLKQNFQTLIMIMKLLKQQQVKFHNQVEVLQNEVKT